MIKKQFTRYASGSVQHHAKRLSGVLAVMSLSFGLSLGITTHAHAGGSHAAGHDHMELEATLHVPYQAKVSSQARDFTLKFMYPTNGERQMVFWRLQVLGPDGKVVEEKRGQSELTAAEQTVTVPWPGRIGKQAALNDGIYRAKLTAFSLPEKSSRQMLAAFINFDSPTIIRTEILNQAWDFRVGNTAKPLMPAFKPLTTSADVAKGGAHLNAKSAATGSLPYTVYYTNLHSQTNHSDGGGNVSTCTSSQPAQSGQFGPADAFAYAKAAGLDALMTSEHNHYFDGSSSTNTSANPATVKALYQSGLSAANTFNAANPGFLALYGMEWGVINNGGHLNIFGSTELLGWETNASNQLLADTLTAKGDYAALYTLMKQRGLVGQFNHPETSGQFIVGGTALGYSADGEAVMALAEILNTSAFSSNTTETETGRSNYEAAFNILLERGFRVAPASNQDNHCANWGKSFTNRTGVLIPNNLPLNNANFMDALKARRVFATMDKNSQIVLTANSRLMGESFQNSGALTLTANFANSAGRTASTVQIFEGVPGRNGTVTVLTSTASTTFTPSLGKHFYYAKITQDDGNILWSAPVWVEQVAGTTDTTPPTVSATQSGTSGTISLNATASDNIGVTKVEFYVDGALKGTSTSLPYAQTLNSSTLSNGTHSLVAKAYDAAGNVGTSSTVSFTINNAPAASQLILNGSFESGSTNWTASSGVITAATSAQPARTGSSIAWLNGYGSTHTDTLYQQVSIPSTATKATLSFWLKVASDETTTTSAFDTLTVQLRNSSGTVLTTLATYSNLNKGSSYVQRSFDVSAYKGQTVRVYFEGKEGSQVATSFVIEDVALNVQ